MVTDYKLTQDSDYTNWRHVFDFAIISFIMTFVYHAITFVSSSDSGAWSCD